MTEFWKPAVGFESLYEISSIGRCRRVRSAYGVARIRVLRPGYNRGYAFYVLVDREIRKNLRPHRMVYEAFVGPIPIGMQINHKNGKKADNRLENLEVVTPSENTLHGFRVLGRKPVINAFPGDLNPRAKLKKSQLPEIFRLRALGWSQQRLADKFGIDQTNISRVLRGDTWKSQ